MRVLLAAKHDEFSPVPRTNVLRLLKSTGHGTTHGDEPAARRAGPANASDVSERAIPSDDVGSVSLPVKGLD